MTKPKIILNTENGEKVFELTEGQVLFAGRTAECDICLPTPAVSRRHAILVMRGGKCGIKDLGSGNGTYLNGKRLENPVRLKDGDVIQIATHRLAFATPPKPVRYRHAEETMLIDPSQLLGRLEQSGLETPEETVEQSPAKSAARSARLSASGRGEDAPAAPRAPAETPQTEEGFSYHSGRRKIDENTVRRVRESIRLTPKAPQAPRSVSAAAPDEIGDGEGDGNSGLWDIVHKAVKEEPPQETAEMDLDLGKAAEAGLIGEFTPEEPEAFDLMDVKETLEADDEEEDEADFPVPVSAPAPVSASAPSAAGAVSVDTAENYIVEEDDDVVLPEGMLPLPPEEANPDAIPVTGKLRQAIESRLFYYSFMEDLRREREELLAENADAPDAVKAEADRQNREMAKPPTADQADDRIEKVNARRDALRQKIREAKAAGTALPPRPSKLMREVEDIGINQWTIISQSLREALPVVFEAGYGMAKREPLARILSETDIDAKMLLGGSVYLLALEELLAEAKFNRAVVKEKLAELPSPDDKKQAKHITPEEVELYHNIKEEERLLALRSSWITQEAAFIEEMLIKEFWAVYTKVALRYIPDHQGMDVAVRAFLRYGVVGFSRWWMKEPIRHFVMDDCANEVRHCFEIGKAITNVCYADEYLAAVMEERCTPAMDENLEINEKNSPNWKADKALRRLISARATITRTRELVDSLQGRIDLLGQEGAALEERIANLLPGTKNFKAAKQELGQERQAVRIEISKITKLSEKLRESIQGDLAETVTEVEKRFETGELPRPTPEFLIEREVGQIRRIGRLTANLKERLLPLAMREYQVDTDAANDRLSIIGEIAEVERRDPRIFLETLVSSKKKANRVDLRISPVIVLVPSAGVLAFAWNPRQKPEDGRLAFPTFFTRQRIRERQVTYLMSDFRWDTEKSSAGMDLMNSETIVAEFMRVRWDWRKRSKEMREKGLVYTEQNDRTNWRRVYEAYLTTAFDGGKKLYNRNYDFYERIVGKYFDLPEGVELLRK